MNFDEETRERLAKIESVLNEYLPKETGPQAEIMKAMNYSVRAGGKRIRPLLTLETYRLLGGKSDIIKPFMAAIEMIHTYSLVHDDLPAMDNDEYRRGRKTTHAVFGEDMGVLAGDGLLNYAYETALKAFDMEPTNANIAKATRVLAAKSGIYGMVGGQTIDVRNEGKPITIELLRVMYEWKTGALIEAAMMMGAILAGADEPTVKTIEKLASEVGMAFQIQDDILDITSTQEKLGKPIGSDARNNKMTYASLVGLDQASAEVERLTKDAVVKLETISAGESYLEQLLLWMIRRDR